MTAKKKSPSKPESAASSPTVGLVSLGCPKALVDSERILTQLRAEGYQFSPDYDGADVVIVNTCGFLDSAKEESLNAIGEALAENGKVIVTGCMGAKPEDITKIHPKVLSVTGPHQYEAVVSAVHDAVPPSQNKFIDLVPQQKDDSIGIKLTPRHYAYLKISEGCNNRCSFCIIPSLRGDLASRPVIQVLAEAERLVKGGVKELLVISQDTSAYGVDTKYRPYPWKNRTVRTRFIDLCRELGELGAWVRLHYVYPYPHVDEVFELMNAGKVLPYIDIPFQHAAPAVLKNMRRPGNQEKTLERIKDWRKICPDLTIRSTFIVGFPGETEEDFQTLLEWMKEAQIDRAGCFKYEAVKGAKANELAGAVPEEIKEERFHRFMTLQQDISAKKLKKKIGKTLPVIIDEMGSGGYTGRTQGDAPEIDGCVYVTGSGLKQGDIVNVKITSADEYDLFGEAAA
ncbi:MAG: 30S ribosomal protein S12 methylthiotransferase RimO [Alphaproteobacteria bacterium]|nr:30S ribosomal protein S12 methylthiotransferase RimO [Alphaproteobacteria bacterium]MDE2337103.1 30S ribosomal protein S12 methylthiotransferase RimO [Alphaproteobacteria bacterium]